MPVNRFWKSTVLGLPLVLLLGATAQAQQGADPVRNITPVTDEMLRNPPASDWLMHYWNYAGWSHSPLKQINVQNVRNLQLRWVWSMDDGERQQITPRDLGILHAFLLFRMDRRRGNRPAPR